MSDPKVMPSGDTVTLGRDTYEIGALLVGTLKRVARGLLGINEAGPGVEAFERMVDLVIMVVVEVNPSVKADEIKGDAKQFKTAYETILRVSGLEPDREQGQGEAAA